MVPALGSHRVAAAEGRGLLAPLRAYNYPKRSPRSQRFTRMRTEEALELLDGEIANAAATGTTTIQLQALKKYAEQLRKWHEEDEASDADVPHEARMESVRAKLTKWVSDHQRKHEWEVEMFRSVIEAGLSALKTFVLINGGAAIALLAFAGHLVKGHVNYET